MLSGLVYTCAHLLLHFHDCTLEEKLTSSCNHHVFQGRNCRTRGIPVHSTFEKKNLSSFFLRLRGGERVGDDPFECSPPNFTSGLLCICWSCPHCVPVEGVQLGPLAEPQLGKGLDPRGAGWQTSRPPSGGTSAGPEPYLMQM